MHQGGARDWKAQRGSKQQSGATKVAEGLKGANGGVAKEQDSFGTGGRRRRLGGTISDKGDLKLDETISDKGDLELEGTSGDWRL